MLAWANLPRAVAKRNNGSRFLLVGNEGQERLGGTKKRIGVVASANEARSAGLALLLYVPQPAR